MHPLVLRSKDENPLRMTSTTFFVGKLDKSNLYSKK